MLHRKKKDLLTIAELSSHEVLEILEAARKLKKAPLSKKTAFKDKALALLFQKPSNRTRISFEVAMVQLGGYVLYLSPQEISMGKRESVKDVACVISRYVDGIVARVFDHKDVEELAKYSRVPVINGLSGLAHPCQGLSDIFTMREKKRTLRNVTVAYIGDGNNVLNSLMIACAKTGVSVRIATPELYRPDKDMLELASRTAKEKRAYVEVVGDPMQAATGADFVYTDVWVSMGQEAEREKRLRDFQGFQIDARVMAHAKKDACIMHCLPAHRGEEITADVIDGKHSIIYDQAENRMHVQKAILLRTLKK
jgi:ornithine carbamoyltransferase